MLFLDKVKGTQNNSHLANKSSRNMSSLKPLSVVNSSSVTEGDGLNIEWMIVDVGISIKAFITIKAKMFKVPFSNVNSLADSGIFPKNIPKISKSIFL